MWYENPTFKGIDARLPLSETLSQRWLEITNKPHLFCPLHRCTMTYMTINKKAVIIADYNKIYGLKGFSVAMKKMACRYAMKNNKGMQCFYTYSPVVNSPQVLAGVTSTL